MQTHDRGARSKDSRGLDELRELDALQARESLPDIEPPDLVDQAVRNLARRELQNSPVPGIGNKLRWIAGLSTVSVALLAIGISMVQAPRLPPAGKPGLRLDQPQREKLPEAVQAPQALAEPEAGAGARNESTRLAAPAPVAQERDAGLSREARQQQSKSAAEEPATTLADEMYATDLADGDAGAEETRESADSGSSEAWLALVRQLYDQGLLVEASEQLEAFVAAHPDHELPGWARQLRAQPE